MAPGAGLCSTRNQAAQVSSGGPAVCNAFCRCPCGNSSTNMALLACITHKRDFLHLACRVTLEGPSGPGSRQTARLSVVRELSIMGLGNPLQVSR